MKLTHIHAATLANGGATFAANGDIVTTGYSVAGIAPAIRIQTDRFTVETLTEAVNAFWGGMFGTWIENGEVWIEPTSIILDRESADRIARDRAEIAYFNLDAMEEIRL